VQVFGGAGFVEDYPAERFWRDARVNRIFEGTNEINRLLVPGRLVRRAMKGELPFFQKAMALLEEIMAGPQPSEMEDGLLAAETKMLQGAKKAALMCLGSAAQKFGQELAEQQEVLGHFADIAMETYALESALLRTRKRALLLGDDKVALQVAAVQCFAQDAMDKIEVSARRMMAGIEEGDTLRTMLAALKRFTKRDTLNTVALRRQVAAAVVENSGYCLS
jgi:alkylation response protein AidB-like acyl-CoA dehydrogenase